MVAPEVSVVIPSRDRPSLLTSTLRSVRRQEHVDLEIIVVDDGSACPVAEILGGSADSRLRVRRLERPQGVAAARNHGIADTQGTWVAFCDDDDLWAPSKLRRQLDAADTAGAPWVYGGAVGFRSPGLIAWSARPPAGSRLLPKLAHRNVVPGGCSNVVARRDALLRVGAFDPRLRVLADWDLWIRLARMAVPATVDEPLVAYRLHGGNMSADVGGVLQELRLIDAASEDLRDGAPLDTVWLHRWQAQAALRSGARWAAAVSYAQAARGGDLLSFGRSMSALLGPRLVWRVDVARRRRRLSDGWHAPAREWLTDLLGDEDRGSPGD